MHVCVMQQAPPSLNAREVLTHQSLHSARLQLAKTPRRAAGEDSVKKSRAMSTSIGSTFLRVKVERCPIYT